MEFSRGFLYGLSFFAPHRYKRRKSKIEKIKSQLDRGFELDKNNLSNDWKMVGVDFKNLVDKHIIFGTAIDIKDKLHMQ